MQHKKTQLISKIFIISLQFAQERRELMRSQLSRLNIEYQFVNACDAKQIDDDELHAVNKHRLYERDLTKAEIACAKSHVEACREMANDKRCDFGLLLEDDVILGNKLPIILKELQKIDLTNTVCLLYSPIYKNTTLHKTIDLCPGYGLTYAGDIQNINGCQAYYIDKNTAKVLSERLQTIRTVSDDWDTHLANGLFSDLKLVYPFPVLHAELLSVINKSKITVQFNLRVSTKNLIYRNKIFPFYQLFLWNRRRIAESRQRKFINAPDYTCKKTYKL